MKKVFIIILILLLPIVYAQPSDIAINLPKETYNAGETLQAKVIFTTPPLGNFEIYLGSNSNEKTPIGAILVKLSDLEYYFYFDIPLNIEKGDYDLILNNIIFIKNDILVEDSASKKITINNVNKGYPWLKTKTPPSDVIGNSFYLLALRNVGLSPKYDALLDEQDRSGCFPKDDCKVKETALALLALNKLGMDISKGSNWLEGSQNNKDLGLWDLKITAPPQNTTCTLNEDTINIVNGQAIEPLGLPNDPEITLNLNCSSVNGVITAEVVNTYLGNPFVYYKSNDKEATIKINNEKCFSINYRTSCNYESTLFATYVLKKLNKEKPDAVGWLKQNYDDSETLHHAMLTLIDSFQTSKDWLINNQKDGAWSTKALIYEKPTNLYVTAIATAALKNTEYSNNSINWLKSQQKFIGSWNNSVMDTSVILYFVFPEDKLVPTLSINPGLIISYINQQLPTRLTISNVGEIKTSVTLTTNSDIVSSKNSLLLNPGSSDSVFITVDPTKITTDSSIQITYSNYTYAIPVLKTAQEAVSITTNPLRFVTEKPQINFYILSNEPKEGIITFKNFGTIALNNITLELTGDLPSIVFLDTKHFSSIGPDETKEIFTRVNKGRNADRSSYSGEVIINSNEGASAVLPVQVEITDYVWGPEETTGVENETDSKGNETTKPEQEQKKGWFSLIVVIIIIIIFVLLGVWYFMHMKKKAERKPPGTNVQPMSREGARFREELEKIKQKPQF